MDGNASELRERFAAVATHYGWTQQLLDRAIKASGTAEFLVSPALVAAATGTPRDPLTIHNDLSATRELLPSFSGTVYDLAAVIGEVATTSVSPSIDHHCVGSAGASQQHGLDGELRIPHLDKWYEKGSRGIGSPSPRGSLQPTADLGTLHSIPDVIGTPAQAQVPVSQQQFTPAPLRLESSSSDDDIPITATARKARLRNQCDALQAGDREAAAEGRKDVVVTPPPISSAGTSSGSDSEVPLSRLRRGKDGGVRGVAGNVCQAQTPAFASRQVPTTQWEVIDSDSSDGGVEICLASIKKAHMPPPRAAGALSGNRKASLSHLRRSSVGIRSRYVDDECGATDSDTSSDDDESDATPLAPSRLGYDMSDGFVVEEDEVEDDGSSSDDKSHRSRPVSDASSGSGRVHTGVDSSSSGASSSRGSHDSNAGTSGSDTELNASRKVGRFDTGKAAADVRGDENYVIGGSLASKNNPRSATTSTSSVLGLCDGDINPKTGLVHICEEHSSGSHISHAGKGVSQQHRFKSRKQRDAITAALTAEYNRTVFGGSVGHVPVQWSARLTKTAGQTIMCRSKRGDELEHTARIALSEKVLDSPHKLAQTLLHELCHAAVWLVDKISKPPHGTCFQKWGSAATRVYPARTVTVCHSYEIQYKFRYSCVSCGFIYGRHSKSIDTVKARCARPRCGGKLTLLAPQKADGSVAETRTTRAPSAYQTFMKESRGAVTSTQPGLTPQQVMVEVARLWSSKKPHGGAGAGAAIGVGEWEGGGRAVGGLLSSSLSLANTGAGGSSHVIGSVDDDDDDSGYTSMLPKMASLAFEDQMSDDEVVDLT